MPAAFVVRARSQAKPVTASAGKGRCSRRQSVCVRSRIGAERHRGQNQSPSKSGISFWRTETGLSALSEGDRRLINETEWPAWLRAKVIWEMSGSFSGEAVLPCTTEIIRLSANVRLIG